MRLIYEGSLQHAQQMLLDLKHGKDDFVKFIDTAGELSYDCTSFHGDVELPPGFLKETDQECSYLYPTMHLTTPTYNSPYPRTIEVLVERLEGQDLNAQTIQNIIESTIRDTTQRPLPWYAQLGREVRQYLDVKIQPKNRRFIPEDLAEFQTLPSFDLQGFELSSGRQRQNGEPGYAQISYYLKKGDNSITVAEIRIEDFGKGSESYQCGQELATLIPSAQILYLDYALVGHQRGWEWVWKGHFWDEGKVIIAPPGSAEYQEAEIKERRGIEEARKRVREMGIKHGDFYRMIEMLNSHKA